MRFFTALSVITIFMSVVVFGGKKVKTIRENSEAKIISLKFEKNGNFPGSKLPVVIYKNVYKEPDSSAIISNMKSRNWHNFWRNGVYSFHHYHSTAHEVLACYSGSAKVQLGGPDGKIIDFEKGDVVVIPAGVAHKKIESKDSFAVLGGYPKGQYVDMKYGKPEELEKATKQIKAVALPKEDPVFGKTGKLGKLWNFKSE